MRLDDRIVGLLLGLLATAVILLARQIPAVPGTTFGPDLMPTLIGVAMAGAAARIFWLGWRAASPGPLLDVSDWNGQERGLVCAAWAIGGTLIGIFFLNDIGFPLYSVCFALPLMLLMGARPIVAVPVALVLTLAAYAAFTRLLLVPLPAGPLLFLR